MKSSSRRFDRIIAGGLLGTALATIPVDFAEARRFRLGSGIRSVGHNGQALAKSYSADHLTPDQLKACLSSERRLEKAGADLDQRKEALTKSQEAIRLEKIGVELAQSRVDRYSQRSVDQFNSLVEKFNARVASNGQNIDAYNRDLESQKIEASRFNTSCGGKRYYEDDLKLAMSQLGIAAE